MSRGSKLAYAGGAAATIHTADGLVHSSQYVTTGERGKTMSVRAFEAMGATPLAAAYFDVGLGLGLSTAAARTPRLPVTQPANAGSGAGAATPQSFMVAGMQPALAGVGGEAAAVRLPAPAPAPSPAPAPAPVSAQRPVMMSVADSGVSGAGKTAGVATRGAAAPAPATATPAVKGAAAATSTHDGPAPRATWRTGVPLDRPLRILYLHSNQADRSEASLMGDIVVRGHKAEVTAITESGRRDPEHRATNGHRATRYDKDAVHRLPNAMEYYDFKVVSREVETQLAAKGKTIEDFDVIVGYSKGGIKGAYLSARYDIPVVAIDVAPNISWSALVADRPPSWRMADLTRDYSGAVTAGVRMMPPRLGEKLTAEAHDRPFGRANTLATLVAGDHSIIAPDALHRVHNPIIVSRAGEETSHINIIHNAGEVIGKALEARLRPSARNPALGQWHNPAQDALGTNPRPLLERHGFTVSVHEDPVMGIEHLTATRSHRLGTETIEMSLYGDAWTVSRHAVPGQGRGLFDPSLQLTTLDIARHLEKGTPDPVKALTGVDSHGAHHIAALHVPPADSARKAARALAAEGITHASMARAEAAGALRFVPDGLLLIGRKADGEVGSVQHVRRTDDGGWMSVRAVGSDDRAPAILPGSARGGALVVADPVAAIRAFEAGQGRLSVIIADPLNGAFLDSPAAQAAMKQAGRVELRLPSGADAWVAQRRLESVQAAVQVPVRIN